MFMTLKVIGAMPLHMLDLQKQASLSLTMSDFLSLNMSLRLRMSLSHKRIMYIFRIPMTPTILRVITEIV